MIIDPAYSQKTHLKGLPVIRAMAQEWRMLKTQEDPIVAQYQERAKELSDEYKNEIIVHPPKRIPSRRPTMRWLLILSANISTNQEITSIIDISSSYGGSCQTMECT